MVLIRYPSETSLGGKILLVIMPSCLLPRLLCRFKGLAIRLLLPLVVLN